MDCSKLVVYASMYNRIFVIFSTVNLNGRWWSRVYEILISEKKTEKEKVYGGKFPKMYKYGIC